MIRFPDQSSALDCADKADAAVAVNYVSSETDADRVVGAIVRDGGEAVAIQADVGQSADVKRLFAETRAKLGASNILVNNAAVFSFGALEAVTEQEFHRQFDTNVLGANSDHAGSRQGV